MTPPGGSGYESPEDDNPFPPHLRPPIPNARPGARQDRDPERGDPQGRSLNGMLAKAQNMRAKVSIGDRIACFRWTWFTMTMATGGIANVLHTRVYRISM